jgi:hypothetical protein
VATIFVYEVAKQRKERDVVFRCFEEERNAQRMVFVGFGAVPCELVLRPRYVRMFSLASSSKLRASVDLLSLVPNSNW